MDAIRKSLKNPKDIHKSIEELLTSNILLKKELTSFRKENMKRYKDIIKNELEQINGMRFFSGILSINAEDSKTLVLELRKEMTDVCIVIGIELGDRAALTIGISDALVTSKDLNAMAIIQNIAPKINGGGGGQPFFATAGGKKPSG